MTLPSALKKDAFAVSALAILFAVLYHFTATRAFSYDSITHALEFEFGDWDTLFHPNHPLFSLIGLVVFKLMLWTGQAYRALMVLQTMNAVVAGLAVALLFWILLPDFGRTRALIGAALLGFSHAFWVEAVDPGCYAWATLAACGVLGLLLRAERIPAFGLGVLHGVAILLHQLLVFTVPSMLLKRGRRGVWAYLAGLGCSAGGAYALICLLFHNGSLSEALHWVFAPAGQSGPALNFFRWWDFSLIQGLKTSLTASAESFIGLAKFHPAIGAFVSRTVLLFGGFLIFASVRYLKGRRLEGNTWAALWLWILAMYAFLIFYLPGALRFRLLIMPAVIYVVLAVLKQYPKSRRTTVYGGIGLVMIAVINFTQVIQPQSRLDTNRDLLRAIWISRTLPHSNAFLFSGVGQDSIINVYVAYFAPQVNGRSIRGYFFQQPGGDLTPLKNWLAAAKRAHQRVWLEAALLTPEKQAELEKLGQAPSGTLKRWLSTLRLGKESIAPDGYGVYEVI